MTKIRLILILLTMFVVGGLGIFASYYARGYRLNPKTLRLNPSGILVVKSEPDGAQVFINGDLKTATNTTVNLSPGTYDISIRKEGYLPWYKRLTVEKEVVTEANASLFRSVPSLTPVTFAGAFNPVASRDLTKIAYGVLPGEEDKAGLWIMESLNLPLGFSRDPRRITDGDITDGNWLFSPDGRQILLTLKAGVYLLDTGTFTPQNQRVNVASRKAEILAGWDKEEKILTAALVKDLPDEINDVLTRKSSSVEFSPDETKILYVASGSAALRENLIKALPGSSTQKQERDIKEGRTYIYDIKEDRNFLITDRKEPLVKWFPTSRHLVLAEDGSITIMDYDGTNRQVIYSGSYIAPSVFPFGSVNKLLILTNLGAGSSFPNLYSVSLR